MESGSIHDFSSQVTSTQVGFPDQFQVMRLIIWCSLTLVAAATLAAAFHGDLLFWRMSAAAGAAAAAALTSVHGVDYLMSLLGMLFLFTVVAAVLNTDHVAASPRDVNTAAGHGFGLSSKPPHFQEEVRKEHDTSSLVLFVKLWAVFGADVHGV